MTLIDTVSADPEAGLLPEAWVADPAFLSKPTGPGRDFTNTRWIWRDPAVSLLPLMLHTETDVGHMGAELAGFVTDISFANGLGTMRGRFYDSDNGRAARDLLLGGRKVGVSVDPGEQTVAEERCVAEDADGFCVESTLDFPVYEVIGLTQTPFPGFAEATISLAEPVAASSVSATVSWGSTTTNPVIPCRECEDQARLEAMVAASAPARPPAAWFANPQFDRLTPLRIADDGQISGHLAPWGQCHTGSQGECILTPHSLTNYAHFLRGYVQTDDGQEIATGVLSVGGGHADRLLSYVGAVEHYDNVAAAMGDIAVGEDAFGIWCAGGARPGLTETQLRTFRASPPSGDWRPIGAGLELVAACAVNSPGFTIARVASSGRVLSLVAAGHGVMAALANADDDRLAAIEARLDARDNADRAPARQVLRDLAVDRLRRVG